MTACRLRTEPAIGRVRGDGTASHTPGRSRNAYAASGFSAVGVPDTHMTGVDLTAFVEGIVHEPTQTEGEGLDLTVAAVYEVTEPGRIDFGGGELTPAGTEPHPSAKRDPDDDYGWWTLGSGQYLLEYNETVDAPADTRLVVQTRDELRTRGAFHPTLYADDLSRVPLSVGGAGLKLKENARVSTVVGVERV